MLLLGVLNRIMETLYPPPEAISTRVICGHRNLFVVCKGLLYPEKCPICGCPTDEGHRITITLPS